MANDDLYIRNELQNLIDKFGSPVIHETLQYLVDVFGLSVVYETLRSFPGYCENCGCPIEEGEQHSLQGFGMCITPTS